MSHTGTLQRRLFDATGGSPRKFYISKHDSTHLHYDFRLEHAGVLKSWAINMGPCLDAAVRRPAVLVKDHALEDGIAEWPIPAEMCGAGRSKPGAILVWDAGLWETDQDVDEALYAGRLTFRLRGQKLKGLWSLILSSRKPSDRCEQWVLKKEFDDEARSLSEMDILVERPESVRSGRTLEEVARLPLPF